MVNSVISTASWRSTEAPCVKVRRRHFFIRARGRPGVTRASHLWGHLPPVLQPGELRRGGARRPAVQPQRVPFVDLDVLGADLDLRQRPGAAGAGL